jgi:plastocyanin
MQRFHRSLLLVGLIAVLALGACGKDDKGDQGAKPPPSSAQGSVPLSGDAPVDIAVFEFKPQTVTVRPGTKVTWTNRDTAIHSIKDTSSLATPVSKELGKGDTFSTTFPSPGSFSYICGIHTYMKGTVEVVN